MKKNILVSLASFLLVSWINAQSLELSMSPESFSVGQYAIIRLSWSDIINFDTVRIDGLDQLEVVGQQIASDIQTENGKATTHHLLSLQVWSKKAGTITLGPAHLPISGWTIDSNSLQLTINPESQKLITKLKGIQNIKKPILERKYMLTLWVCLGTILVIWYLQMKQSPKVPKQSIIQEIQKRPDVELGRIDRIGRIPTQDDPDVIEKTEQLLRAYLQSLRRTNVYHLTYQELLQLNSHQSGNLRVDMETLRRILMLMQKAKYAKQIIETKEFLNHMKQLLQDKV